MTTLRYSRRGFRREVWTSSQQVWAELHQAAWRYFGGSGHYVVLDNLKEGVLNKIYAATLAHYGVVADPARVQDYLSEIKIIPNAMSDPRVDRITRRSNFLELTP